MEEKEIIIDKSKLWSYNENLYTEEFRKKLHEERRKANQEIIDRVTKEREEEKKNEQAKYVVLLKAQEKAWSRGEITSTFIKQHLEAKITTARWMLAIAMGMTLLFKGFWALWILFIFLYNWQVKRFKKEALEADMKRGKKK